MKKITEPGERESRTRPDIGVSQITLRTRRVINHPGCDHQLPAGRTRGAISSFLPATPAISCARVCSPGSLDPPFSLRTQQLGAAERLLGQKTPVARIIRLFDRHFALLVFEHEEVLALLDHRHCPELPLGKTSRPSPALTGPRVFLSIPAERDCSNRSATPRVSSRVIRQFIYTVKRELPI